METVTKVVKVPETYRELKARQQKEFNNFEGMFFAFSNERLYEGMKAQGLDPKDTDKIVSIGAGGFLLKSRREDFRAMNKRFEKEKRERSKEEKYLVEAIAYELANHEFAVTGDATDALEELDVDAGTLDPKILDKAIEKYVSAGYSL